jgi:hypothetical protein
MKAEPNKSSHGNFSAVKLEAQKLKSSKHQAPKVSSVNKERNTAWERGCTQQYLCSVPEEFKEEPEKKRFPCPRSETSHSRNISRTETKVSISPFPCTSLQTVRVVHPEQVKYRVPKRNKDEPVSGSESRTQQRRCGGAIWTAAATLTSETP